MTANGAEGAIGESGYIQLWPVEELKSMNDAYEVAQFAAGLLLFGSDGGGSGYAFDAKHAMEVVDVPLVGLSRSEISAIAPTFDLFIERVSQG